MKRSWESTDQKVRGPSYANGGVQVDLVRVCSGVETDVAQWARSESQDVDHAWQRELTSFVALAGDTYYGRGHSSALPCTTASIRGVLSFDQVRRDERGGPHAA